MNALHLSSDYVGEIIQNRYFVKKIIGRGGMANVYQCWDNRINKFVALKILHQNLVKDYEFINNFRDEARALAQLSHDNIVNFYSFEQEGYLAFIVMEYIEGKTLRDLLLEKQGVGLNFDEYLEIITPICEALQYAHSLDVIHCDIKPANILISNEGEIKLTDFGIARSMSSTISRYINMGTFAYMSPEQALGKKPTPETDIFALGIISYEMLSGGIPPFASVKGVNNLTDNISRKSTFQNISSLHVFQQGLPDRIDEVISYCITKESQDRYPSVKRFLDHLLLISKEINNSISNLQEDQINTSRYFPSKISRTPPAIRTSQRFDIFPKKYYLWKQHSKIFLSFIVLILLAIVVLLWTLSTNRSYKVNSCMVIDRNSDYLDLCINQANLFVFGFLKLELEWQADLNDPAARFIVVPLSDKNSLYLTDQFGNRYEYLLAWGSATTEFTLYDGENIKGWILFKVLGYRTNHYTLHDGDENIETPSFQIPGNEFTP
jgi:eukaryotic-like serine/threonine-protein kinase